MYQIRTVNIISSGTLSEVEVCSKTGDRILRLRSGSSYFDFFN